MKLLKLIFVFFLLSFNLQAQDQKDSIRYIKPLFDFDPMRATLRKNVSSAAPDNWLRSVLLTGYREGVAKVPGFANFSSMTDPVSGLTRLYMYNLSIEEMLTHGLTSSSDVELEVKDPQKYRYNKAYGDKVEWMRKNSWCLEIMLPAGKSSAEFLEAELSRLFKVKFGFQKRTSDVLLLVRTSNKDKLKSKLSIEGTLDMHGHFNGVALQNIDTYLKQAGLPKMIDETGYNKLVDLDLDVTPASDLTTIRKELNRYDLDLVPARREIEKFIITETPEDEN